jgi:hypothetical protein
LSKNKTIGKNHPPVRNDGSRQTANALNGWATPLTTPTAVRRTERVLMVFWILEQIERSWLYIFGKVNMYNNCRLALSV